MIKHHFLPKSHTATKNSGRIEHSLRAQIGSSTSLNLRSLLEICWWKWYLRWDEMREKGKEVRKQRKEEERRAEQRREGKSSREEHQDGERAVKGLGGRKLTQWVICIFWFLPGSHWKFPSDIQLASMWNRFPDYFNVSLRKYQRLTCLSIHVTLLSFTVSSNKHPEVLPFSWETAHPSELCIKIAWFSFKP